MPLKDEVEGLAEWLAGLMAEDSTPATDKTAMPYAEDWENAAGRLVTASEKFTEGVRLLDVQIARVDRAIKKLDETPAKRFDGLTKHAEWVRNRTSKVRERERLSVLRDLASDLDSETGALSARAGVLHRRAEPLPASVKQARARERDKAATPKEKLEEEALKQERLKTAALEEQLDRERLESARARAVAAGGDALKIFEADLQKQLLEEKQAKAREAEREAKDKAKAADAAASVREGQRSVETAREWIKAPEDKKLDESSLAFLEELDVLAEMALGLRQRIERAT